MTTATTTASTTAERRLLPFSDRAISWALYLASFVFLFAAERAVGFVRDESVYFHAAESYANWYRLLFSHPGQALTDASITQGWSFNNEHPAVMKTLFGWSFLIFHSGLGLLKASTAFRLPAFLIAALVPPLLFKLGKSLFGELAGLFAALSFFLVPRQFFNAELACFDLPVAAFWLLTVFCFLRAQTEKRYWIYAGLAFGLTIGTKHNGLFLPFVLTPFALYRAFVLSRHSPAARKLFELSLWLTGGVAVLYGAMWILLGRQAFQARFEFFSPATFLFFAFAAGAGVLLYRWRQIDEPSFRAVASVPAMAVLGPVIFYLSWPYLWHQPIERAAWYLDFHATHNHYTWFYLGTLLREPPFPLMYVVVKTALTVPTSLFVPMVTGLVVVAARCLPQRDSVTGQRRFAVTFAELVVLANAGASILVISHPQVPHFGGVKHWFPSMPFLALLAGASVQRVIEFLAAELRTRKPALPSWLPIAGVFALLLIPALVALVRVHPYGTSYYSELGGGIPGAASLGMQRQFWSNNVTGVLPWINENAPRGARVWLHEVNGFSFRDYQRNGMLREDLQPAGGWWDSQIAAYQYHQEFREHEYVIWNFYGTQKPSYGLYLDETPQVVVYVRR